MNLMLKLFILFAVLSVNFVCFSKEIIVAPQNTVIALSSSKNQTATLAAKELRNHLELITGKNIPLVSDSKIPAKKYVFRVGIAAPGDTRKLTPEEARWKVTPTGAYFYGDDSHGRYGTLFAVCDFLEKQLGVRWIEPGDVAFRRQNPLRLSAGSGEWQTKLRLRSIRRGLYGKTPQKISNPALREFQQSPTEYAAAKSRIQQWQKRVRMGSHNRPSYGHAFTKWWTLYGKSHPEYFALNPAGKRAPAHRHGQKGNVAAATGQSAQQIKLCVSNPAITKQIVKNWQKSKKQSNYINACVNDSPPRAFCACSACRKLDVMRKGEKFMDHLTDRYVYFGNQITREARKHNPNAKTVIYAYNETEYAPRRQKLAKGLCIGLVPTHFELASINKLFSGWYRQGATEIFFRPNQHCYFFTVTIPPGFEKHFYDVLQTALKNNTIGFDYDSLKGWLVTGLADYVLAKAMSEPEKSFTHWESHYLDAFGPAKPDVQKYYQYWRKQVWDKRIAPKLTDIVKKGKYFNFARGLMWNLEKYYKKSDFDQTDAYLAVALQHKLSPEETARIKRLQLINQHARLVFNAVTTQGHNKFSRSAELLAFRRKHHKELKNVRWPDIFKNETYWGDITGINAAMKFKDFSLPFIQTPLFWRFKLDPNNIGQKNGWYKAGYRGLTGWDFMPTNHFWEAPHKHYKYPTAATRKKLPGYNGIGWYSLNLKVPQDWKNRKVFLYFGSVDESCWIYVNGKLAGKHLFQNPADWKTPFTIEISKMINWNQLRQRITVRVEDKAGAGGIWKRIWLVSKKQP